MDREEDMDLENGSLGVWRATPSSNLDCDLLDRMRFFEQKLKMYKGEDPISVWMEYIEWSERSLPSDGDTLSAKHVVERFFQFIEKNQKYEGDLRVFQLKMKYSNLPQPLQMFEEMYHSKSPPKVALFYIQWSSRLAALGKIKAARDVLVAGINMRAEPHNILQSAIVDLYMKTPSFKSDPQGYDSVEALCSDFANINFQEPSTSSTLPDTSSCFGPGPQGFGAHPQNSVTQGFAGLPPFTVSKGLIGPPQVILPEGSTIPSQSQIHHVSQGSDSTPQFISAHRFSGP